VREDAASRTARSVAAHRLDYDRLRTPYGDPAVASPSPVTGRLPLSALLSQTLVGYTIEFDNEAEHRLPHRTQDHGRSPGAAADAPWLTSLVMWANCLRHGTPRSIRVSDSVCTSGTVRRSLAAGHPRVAA